MVFKGHGDTVKPYVGKLVVAYQLATIFSTESRHQLYVLVSSADKTTRRDMNFSVMKATLKPK